MLIRKHQRKRKKNVPVNPPAPSNNNNNGNGSSGSGGIGPNNGFGANNILSGVNNNNTSSNNTNNNNNNNNTSSNNCSNIPGNSNLENSLVVKTVVFQNELGKHFFSESSFYIRLSFRLFCLFVNFANAKKNFIFTRDFIKKKKETFILI
jgi:hypothetical protein